MQLETTPERMGTRLRALALLVVLSLVRALYLPAHLACEEHVGPHGETFPIVGASNTFHLHSGGDPGHHGEPGHHGDPGHHGEPHPDRDHHPHSARDHAGDLFTNRAHSRREPLPVAVSYPTGTWAIVLQDASETVLRPTSAPLDRELRASDPSRGPPATGRA